MFEVFNSLQLWYTSIRNLNSLFLNSVSDCANSITSLYKKDNMIFQQNIISSSNKVI